MLICINDIFIGEAVELTASFTTDHPASHYGQPVIYIDEWGDCISHLNWVLGGAKLIDATPDEQTSFTKWHELIDIMTNNCCKLESNK